MADPESDRARERAHAAIARVGTCLAAGALPDPEADRELAEFAARIDARLWEQHRPGASGASGASAS